MNYLDFIILILVLLFAINGYRKGIIISLASIAALVLGIYCAVFFSNYLDATLMEHLRPSRKWLPVLSFTLTFLLVVFIVFIVAKLVEKLVDVAGLGFMNKLGGAVLGVVKGMIMVSILIFITNSIDRQENTVTAADKKGSQFYGPVSQIFPYLMKEFGGEIKFPSWPAGKEIQK